MNLNVERPKQKQDRTKNIICTDALPTKVRKKDLRSYRESALMYRCESMTIDILVRNYLESERLFYRKTM